MNNLFCSIAAVILSGDVVTLILLSVSVSLFVVFSLSFSLPLLLCNEYATTGANRYGAEAEGVIMIVRKRT
jgi:hypothetical protein